MSLLARNRPSQITDYPPPLTISEEVYWRDYYEQSDTIYEWNNGILEEKPVSDYETFLIYSWFVNLLRLFLQTHPLASMTGLEMGFKLHLPNNKITVRKPDLGIVLKTNPVQLQHHDMRYHGVFDVCVEALSDSTRKERERDTLIKKSEYAAAGIKEYLILHHAEQQFYRLNESGVYVPMIPQNGVIRSQVLTGFQFRIADLWNRPTEEKMIRDAVYRKFVFPAWQAVEQRAQIETELRRAAEQRAQIEAEFRRAAEERAAALQTELDLLKLQGKKS